MSADSALPAAPHPVGVLGGMGPAATLDFMAKVLRETGAAREQDNVRLIVDDNPHVPDRNLASAGGGRSPGPVLAEMARGLERAGAGALAIACNSAHAFAADVRAAVSIPLLDMVGETVEAVDRLATRPEAVGVLAADACLEARLYQDAFTRRGLKVLQLGDEAQVQFMAVLYRVKAGAAGRVERAEMAALAHDLVERGAQAIVSACTEVPLVLIPSDIDTPLIDSTDALVARVIRFARNGR